MEDSYRVRANCWVLLVITLTVGIKIALARVSVFAFSVTIRYRTVKFPVSMLFTHMAQVLGFGLEFFQRLRMHTSSLGAIFGVPCLVSSPFFFVDSSSYVNQDLVFDGTLRFPYDRRTRIRRPSGFCELRDGGGSCHTWRIFCCNRAFCIRRTNKYCAWRVPPRL
jgi:hypothetical protein